MFKEKYLNECEDSSIFNVKKGKCESIFNQFKNSKSFKAKGKD